MLEMEQIIISRISDTLANTSSPTAIPSLERSLIRLREVSAQFERQSVSNMPAMFQPFLELVNTQTAVIEALLQHRDQNVNVVPASTEPREEASQPIVQRETIRRELSIKTNPSTEWKMVEERTRTVHHSRRRQSRSMSETSVDIANIYFKIEEPNHAMQHGPSMTRMQSQPRMEEILETKQQSAGGSRTLPANSNDHAKVQHPSRRSDRPSILSIVIPKSMPVPLVSPLTPEERSWFLDPTPPTAGLSRHSSWRMFHHNTLLEHVPEVHNNSHLNLDALDSKASHSSCLSCNDQPWLSSDSNAEAHVQEVISSLISSMKQKKRVSVGPLAGGTFALYSTDYRDYHCVHQDNSRQRLVFFKSAADWTDMIHGVSPPLENQIAMQLVVDPDCRMVILPFNPPKHAGWKWHELNSLVFNPRESNGTTMINAEKRNIEVMFIGNGFLKLRIRLSDLVGSKKGFVNLPDRFMEFAGIWQTTSGTAHRLRIQQPATSLKLKNSLSNLDSGFRSTGSPRTSGICSGRHEARGEKNTTSSTNLPLDLLSPVSPV